MIILVAGATHVGKTAFAQKLLEKYHYPYLSIDHLKMGLIRSGNTTLTPLSREEDLTEYLWPIVREIIKTAIENDQNLIVEGCYIPFDWQKDFSNEHLAKMQYFCLILGESYVKTHFSKIKEFANVIEKRQADDDLTVESLLEENAKNLEQAKKHNVNHVLIQEDYETEIESKCLC